MPFDIPDLKALAQRTKNAFRANLMGTDAWLWPNNVTVSAKVFAGAVWELFCRLKEIDKQRFADTATGYNLEHHGRIYGLGKNPATYAQGHVDVPAAYPFTVPAGTPFERSDGVIYVSSVDTSAVPYSNSGVVSVLVVCQTAGLIGNSIAGTPLSTTLSGLTGGTTTVAVSDDGIGSGNPAEGQEPFRSRVLARIRKPPMGGADYDYEAWAKTVPGVTRVFVVGNAYGRGTVGVWFLMDGTYTQGIPQPADVETVQSYIDSVAPVTATVIVAAPIADPIDVIVEGVTPATQAVYQSVAAEMFALFSKVTRPSLPTQPFTLYHSALEGAVDNATGEQFNEGVSQPSSDQTPAVGVMPVLNTITFRPLQPSQA